MMAVDGRPGLRRFASKEHHALRGHLKVLLWTQAGQVEQMATAEHPEALRLQREVGKLRQRNSFKDADFRDGSLLQNVMEALSKLLVRCYTIRCPSA